MNKQMPPLAVEPLDREWGVGVSGLTKEPSPFPRINRMLDWVNNMDSTADDQRAKIVTECYNKYASYTPALRWALTLRELYESDERVKTLLDTAKALTYKNEREGADILTFLVARLHRSPLSIHVKRAIHGIYDFEKILAQPIV